MLKNLQLENYRCFDSHNINFKNTTIVVGKNNAGKSTMIEALRLISIVANRSLNFSETPKWLDLPNSYKGVKPSLSGIDFSTKNVFHQYQQGPAKITATFTNKVVIQIYLEEIDDDLDIFALIFDDKGNIARSKKDLKGFTIPEINILPQISAVAKEENVLRWETVRSNITTQLSSTHFRNQIKYYYEYFAKFKELSELTWPKLEIKDLDGRSLLPGSQLTLIVRDNQFAAEIGWMGHGLQMWLQTMWFLARSSSDSTVILDEPDVYMHADLQRKLIRFLKKNYGQVILATHSIEIISEVEPEDILVVDKSKHKSLYTSTVPAVQSFISGIGSMQNIGLARLWSSKKMLLVEGKDISILKRIQDTIFFGNCEPFDLIPRSDIGGWSGWQYVVGADLVLKNGLKQDLNVYCILDSDYYDDEVKDLRKKQAKDINISLHIWSKKEIENYLLIPTAIYRIILKKTKNPRVLSLNDIKNKIDEIAESMKLDLIDKVASEIQSNNKNWNISTINKAAREKVDQMWRNKLNYLSGKEIIKRLNTWLIESYKASLTAVTLAKELKNDEIDEELRNVISAIEEGRKLI